MRLLPSDQTLAQRAALTNFANKGELTFREPCDCEPGRVRHNNGGNYHKVVSFKMDAGKCWRTETFTGDYGPDDDWGEVEFSAAIDEMMKLASQGYNS